VNPHAQRPRTDDVRPPVSAVLYRTRWFGRWLIRRRYDVRVLHPERFPARGPVIVAANHIGVIDGPLMAIFAPRPVHAWTKIEMFQGPLGRFLRTVGQIPLDRFRTDTGAVKVALRVLRDDKVVGVFPEGTRGNGELDRFQRGAAYLALVTGAPVAPMTFIGSRDPGGSSGSLPRRGARIDIVVGEPVRFAAVPWPRTRDAVDAVSIELRETMVAGLKAALDETGRNLPGPLPVKDPDD
jgi:1-acyl-sn-glycerol-3-phosphate acyltransferase